MNYTLHASLIGYDDLLNQDGLDVSKEIEEMLVSELSKSIDIDIIKSIFAFPNDRKSKIKSILDKISHSES